MGTLIILMYFRVLRLRSNDGSEIYTHCLLNDKPGWVNLHIGWSVLGKLQQSKVPDSGSCRASVYIQCSSRYMIVSMLSGTTYSELYSVDTYILHLLLHGTVSVSWNACHMLFLLSNCLVISIYYHESFLVLCIVHIHLVYSVWYAV